MAGSKLETERLILRRFAPRDMEALYLLLRDREVNTYLPWFPAESVAETEKFYQARFAGEPYALAICRKEDDGPIGYIHASMDDGHDLGYALRREYWGRGLAAEAGRALIAQLRRDGVPYLTATHDRNNPGSGGVMRKLGMKYCYSYEELWQPKNIPVIFRLFQLNLDGREDRIYCKYWDTYDKHFLEEL